MFAADCFLMPLGLGEQRSVGWQVGLPDSITEEARRIAEAVELADASLHRGAAALHATDMHKGMSAFPCNNACQNI